MNIQHRNEVTGFVRAEGQQIVNGNGKPFLLRGVGLGSWLLPEGYMWRFPEQGDRPRRMEKMIEEVIGQVKAEQFWETYYDFHSSEADIRRIAEEGFNSVRLPINARFLIEDGYPVRFKEQHMQILDRMIDWCKTYKLYVILDLHGAPGGQTGTNIDDSENDQPQLFMEESHRQATIEIWRELASRYKDEWIVAGYDLLNEPLPEWFKMYNDQVMPLYKEITEAIREIDKKHMIILEGAHWATDWSVFDDKFDDNLMLQFHKYWNNPDQESIQKFLDKRDEWNVPIFMGEGGENNIEWYVGAFSLYDDLSISWNFWTWKKITTSNSPCSIRQPEGWQLFVDYLQGGSKPDADTAERILTSYLENMRIENCDYHPEVVNSLLRRPSLQIPAIFYGYRREGISYSLAHKVEQNVGFRVQDGTDIRFIDSTRTTPNFEHGRGQTWADDERLCLQASSEDWFKYEIFVRSSQEYSSYAMEVKMSAVGEDACLTIFVDDEKVESISLQGEEWRTYPLNNRLSLTQGLHQIQLKVAMGTIRMDWLAIR